MRKPRRIIVSGYSQSYCRSLIKKASDKFGSMRQLSFAIGASSSMINRWYNGYQPMGEKWVILLENLLKSEQHQS